VASLSLRRRCSVKVVDHSKELDRRRIFQTWTTKERQCLLRIISEIHRADGVYAPEERDSYDRLTLDLDVDVRASSSVEECIRLLAADNRKVRLLCIFMAEAVLVDGHYDEEENVLLTSIWDRNLLPRGELEAAIRELQLRGVEEVLGKWLEDTSFNP
jgi:hypothetical protein